MAEPVRPLCAVVVTEPANGKCGVHLLVLDKEVKMGAHRLRPLPLERCVAELCSALAAEQRAGSFDFHSYMRAMMGFFSATGSDMTLAEYNMMMELGIGAPTEPQRAPGRVQVPAPRVVISAAQYRDDKYSASRVPEGCNCVYMLLRYCAQAATPGQLIAMQFHEAGAAAAVAAKVEAFVRAHSRMGALFLELGLRGVRAAPAEGVPHATGPLHDSRLGGEAAAECHALTVLRCCGLFRVFHSFGGRFTWAEHLEGGAGWVDGSEARRVLLGASELALGRDASRVPQLSSLMLGLGALEAAEAYAQPTTAKVIGVAEALEFEPAPFLRAGHDLLQQMRKLGLGVRPPEAEADAAAEREGAAEATPSPDSDEERSAAKRRRAQRPFNFLS